MKKSGGVRRILGAKEGSGDFFGFITFVCFLS